MKEGFDWKTSKISVEKSDIDPGQLDMFIDDLPRQFIDRNRELLKNNTFVKEKKGIFQKDEFEKQFSLTGSFKVSTLDELNDGRDFFNQKEGRFFSKSSDKSSEYLLRGPRYICAADSNLSIRQKLQILSEDAFDAIEFLKKQDFSKEEQFKRVAPLLDYVKNTAVTILGGYIHNEKIGKYDLQDSEYMEERSRLIDLVRNVSFAYYLALVDSLEKDTLDDLIKGDMFSVLDEASLKLKKDFENHQFPNDALARPEASHPLVLMGSVGLITSQYPELDTVVGMPSGAIEASAVLAEAQEYFNKRKCDMLLLSISNHTIKTLGLENKTTNTHLSEFVESQKDVLDGKNIIIIDDNASTGGTIERARNEIMQTTKPRSIIATVLEADIVRSGISRDSKERTRVAHPFLFDLSTSVLPVSKSIWPKHDLKEIMETNQLIQSYKEKIKNANTLAERIKYEVFIDDLENPTEKVLEQLTGENIVEKFQGTQLSNFYAVPVVREGVNYPSVEHAYQAAKFDSAVFSALTEDQKGVLAEILKQKGYAKPVDNYEDIFKDPTIPSGITKVFATKLREWGLVRKDWDDVRIEVMIDLLVQKFNTPELREGLLATGDKYLIEGNDWEDTLWGVCNGHGKNMLGRSLMNIRNKIK